MKIDEASINNIAMQLIGEITCFAYDSISDDPKDKLLRDAYLYSVQGIVEFAQKLKEEVKNER